MNKKSAWLVAANDSWRAPPGMMERRRMAALAACLLARRGRREKEPLGRLALRLKADFVVTGG